MKEQRWEECINEAQRQMSVRWRGLLFRNRASTRGEKRLETFAQRDGVEGPSMTCIYKCTPSTMQYPI